MTPPQHDDASVGLSAGESISQDVDSVNALMSALTPQKIAVFGASSTPGKMGHEVVRQLVQGGFAGQLALINPRESSVCGHATKSDPRHANDADVAVIATPQEGVAEVLSECGDARIPLAIVCAGGYREAGNVLAERELVAAARRHGVALLGPNCIGIFAADARLNLSTIPSLPSGHISSIVQSGGVSLQIAHRLAQFDAGFDALINLGNKAGIDFTVALDALESRPHTTSILLYMESFDEGDRFLAALSRITSHVPVILAFGGESEAGSRSARSHTGAILTPWNRLAGVFSSHGAFVAHTLAEAVAAAVAGRRTHGHQRLRGRRTFVVSDGGGLATLAADTLSRAGFVLPQPGKKLQEALSAIPGLDRARPANPLDFTGMADRNPELYPQALEIAHDSGDFDGLLLVGALGSYGQLYGASVGKKEEEAAKAIANLGHRSRIPIVAQSTVATDPSHSISMIRNGGIPCFQWPEEAVAGLALRLRPQFAFGDAAADQREVDAREPAWDAELATDTAEVVSVLRRNHIPHFLGDVVAREEVIAHRGERWVLRLDGFPHKSRAGAIKIVADKEKLTAFDELVILARQLGAEPIIRLAPYLEHSHEILVTYWRSEATGRGWAIGTGGLLTEQAADVQTGGVPESREDVLEVMGRTRIATAILSGKPDTVDELVSLILRLNHLFDGPLAHLDELECNPVAIGDFGVAILDVLPSSGMGTNLNPT